MIPQIWRAESWYSLILGHIEDQAENRLMGYGLCSEQKIQIGLILANSSQNLYQLTRIGNIHPIQRRLML